MSTTSSPHAWRPDEIRRKQFTVRLRGLDPNEVRGFLNALADDAVRLHEQIATMKRDHARQRDELEQAQDGLEQVKGELQRAQDEPHDQVTDQAVQLLEQAQQLADALIEEGLQSARDLMSAARSHQHEIVTPVQEGVHRPVLPAAGDNVGPDPAPSAEIEDVRTFARVAQVQFRAVLDALNDQVNRLDNAADTDDRIPAAADLTPVRTGAANSRRG